MDILDTITGATARAFGSMLNTTPPPLRPLFLASVRSCLEATLSCLDEDKRALYDKSLESMTTIVTTKKKEVQL